MKATVELSLRTREVYQLFGRKIDGDRLFIAAILHKFNLVMGGYRQEKSSAIQAFNQMEHDLLALTQQFSGEMASFEGLLQKKKDFSDKKVNFIAQFHPSIMVSNPLCIYFIEFIEVYDKLMATIKLLHLLGCFLSEQDYFSCIRRNQRMANQLLSRLLLEKKITC